MATSSEIIYNLQLSDSLFDMRKRFDCYVTLVPKLFKRFSFGDHISIDPFNFAGVQKYRGERAAKHKLQMVDISFDGGSFWKDSRNYFSN